uniref:FH2 domain-containing protein n=1 Tax=Ascaris lumbricoides TaxID=6252 RepID=A0A0M3ILV6_ASCLU
MVLQQLSLQSTMDVYTEVNQPITNIDINEILSRNSAECLSPSDPRQSPRPLLLPPVCPPIAPPPPPPPSSQQLTILGGAIYAQPLVKKNVPKPNGPLKSINWTVIPNEKIAGTIWEKIDDEKLYQQLDLAELSENFAMAKGTVEEADSVSGTLRRKYRGGSSISVIEPRRAQNCTIMLSKLRLTNKQITRALLSMDQYGELPRDMLEQMLKFIPTKEEISQLRETVERFRTPSVLAIADRFLYEVSNIPRYEQRLQCLFIITSFKERLDDVATNIQVVSNASISVSNSKRLRYLLRLILAVGNYLNYEKRNGNAFGFTLDSLRLLTDVRNSLRSDRNLLHYIIQIADSKFPEILRLKRDFGGVHDAARHSRVEIEQELQSLRSCLASASDELRNGQHEVSEASTSGKGNEDRLVPTLSNFLGSVSNDFIDVERKFAEMNKKFDECVRLFGEESTLNSPDEFFSILSKFLNSFNECLHQIWQEREDIERIKKQTLARSIFAKKLSCIFDECVRLFGEESTLNSPDEFFSILSKFLNSFNECLHQIWQEREDIERIKKQTLARSIFAKKCSILSKFLNSFNECLHQIWQEREDIERIKKQTLARSIFAKKCSLHLFIQKNIRHF